MGQFSQVYVSMVFFGLINLIMSRTKSSRGQENAIMISATALKGKRTPQGVDDVHIDSESSL